MKQYVTFQKVLDYIKSYQVASPRLNDFGYGDIVYFVNDSGTTTNYPFLFVTPISFQYTENTTIYSLQLIFSDLVNTDLSNEKNVVSDMSLEARRFISEIKRGFLDDLIDIQMPVSSQTFFERFNDHVGGVVLNADIVVFDDINACDPYFYVTPTTTPTPSPTSVTPTPTPTTTPTPTPTPNPQFNAGEGFSNRTDAVMVDSGDAVYVASYFSNWYNGTFTNNNIVKLDNDGIIDTNFVCKPNDVVYKIVDDGLGYLYIAGNFTTINGQTCQRIARVSKTTGALHTNWVGSAGANGAVFGVCVDGTDVIITGSFTTYNGVTKQRIAKISNTNVLDSGAFFNFQSTTWDVIKNRNGNYVAVGLSTTYNGIACQKIIEIDSTTYADTGLIYQATDSNIKNIFQDSNTGDYFYAGNSGLLNGLTTSKINRLDEYFTTVSSTAVGGVPMTSCYYHQPTESLYGIYSQQQPTADYYWKVDTSGGGFIFDSTFNQNLKTVDLGAAFAGNLIQGVAVNSIGKVYLCGSFDTVNSNRNNYIVRVNSDGTSNTNTN